MKIRAVLAALLCTHALALARAAEPAVLLRGGTLQRDDDRLTVREAAQAIVKAEDGQTLIRAAEIAYETKTNRLVCSGAVTLTSRLGTVRGEQLTLELGGSRPAVYGLNADGITLGGVEAAKAPPAAAARLEFQQTLPRLNLALGERAGR
jgi:hypothetical protein